MVFTGEILLGAIMIWTGAVFDFLDGFAARMLNKFSSIGKDLDSLADLVTFCFLPGSILFVLIDKVSENNWLPFIGFLLVLFGALRLARFNNDKRQSENFYGLPVPASAIFVSGFPFISNLGDSGLYGLLTNQYTLAGIAILLSGMMVSNVKLMSLKFKDVSIKSNWSRFVLILFSLLLLILFKPVALPLIIIFYVVLSTALNITE